MKVANANWRQFVDTGEIAGQCQKCQTWVSGGDLHLKVIPFGGGEEYRCSACMSTRVAEPVKAQAAEKRVFL